VRAPPGESTATQAGTSTDGEECFSDVVDAYRRLESWGSARSWLGPDPYEGLNANVAPLVMATNSQLARRLLIQAVKISPVDLRRPLGIRPSYNSKTVALVASGYARAPANGAGDVERWLDRVIALDVLGEKDEAAWGYHFPFQSRTLFYPRDAPNAIATSFVLHALVDGFMAEGKERWLEAAGRGAAFLMRRMLVRRADGGVHFRYVVGHDNLVHNASALAAAVVIRVDHAFGRPLTAEALGALELLLGAQRADGSWPYGDTEQLSWIDSFHTGYVLESLEHARRSGVECGDALARGLEFYDAKLFQADGVTPRSTTRQDLPVDTHSIAQAVDTHAAVARWRPDSLGRALAIARNGMRVARKADGSFVFERRRLWTNRTPLIRWTNAPMFRALASLLAALEASRSADG
jgi:hypothetical protein